MARRNRKRKLVTVMSTEMVGCSTVTNQDLDVDLRREHETFLGQIFVKFAGSVVTAGGDGFVVEFNHALAALRCALAIQEALATRSSANSSTIDVRARIGIHIGGPVKQNGDLLGNSVNVAQRLQECCEPGGVCVSRAVWKQVENKLTEVEWIQLGSTELKGITPAIELFAISPSGAVAPSNPNGSRKVDFRLKWFVGACVVIAALVFGTHRFLKHSGARPAEALVPKPVPEPAVLTQKLVTAPVAATLRDQKPPIVPSGVTAVANSCKQIRISWSGSKDPGVDLARYIVYQNGIFLANVIPPETSILDTNVVPSKVYSYAVLAVDRSGNPSAKSLAVSATTPPCADERATK